MLLCFENRPNIKHERCQTRVQAGVHLLAVRRLPTQLFHKLAVDGGSLPNLQELEELVALSELRAVVHLDDESPGGPVFLITVEGERGFARVRHEEHQADVG